MRFCPQCWRERPDADFIGTRGGYVTQCKGCRRRYGNWIAKSDAQRLAVRRPRRGLRSRASSVRVRLVAKSGNVKTGPIPVSMSSSETCPPSCRFFGAGCYAEFHNLRFHWALIPMEGLTWSAFCEAVAAMPEGTLWRHNEAGDLPGHGERLDEDQFFQLVRANLGRKGFTFTHKPVLKRRRIASAIELANRLGFTINLSADSLEHADELADLEIGPVAVVLPSTATATYTPAGRKVIVCPAVTEAQLTCHTCGLCALPRRKAIVGFPAHGQMARHVDKLVSASALVRRRAP